MEETLSKTKEYVNNSYSPVQIRLDKWYDINPFKMEKNREDFFVWCQTQNSDYNELISTADEYILQAANNFITPEDVKNIVAGCGLNQQTLITSLNPNFNVVISNIPSEVINNVIENIKENYGYDCNKTGDNSITMLNSMLSFNDFIKGTRMTESKNTTTSKAYKNLNDLGNKLLFQVEQAYNADKFCKKMYKTHIFGKDNQDKVAPNKRGVADDSK